MIKDEFNQKPQMPVVAIAQLYPELPEQEAAAYALLAAVPTNLFEGVPYKELGFRTERGKTKLRHIFTGPDLYHVVGFSLEDPRGKMDVEYSRLVGGRSLGVRLVFTQGNAQHQFRYHHPIVNNNVSCSGTVPLFYQGKGLSIAQTEENVVRFLQVVGSPFYALAHKKLMENEDAHARHAMLQPELKK